ncbi:hypothetical protein ACFV2X_52585 [Streptomyces sp. NPDC059679]|uniref:hypothetical protein n=1 Tax=Streptomyces sp. NPDC059679 TaxID=3346903 RepID=UPI003678FF6C
MAAQTAGRTSPAARWATWWRERDPGLAATRRAGRTAIVMPALFALCSEVFHSSTMASFAAFGSFSMLLLVDFSGSMVKRLRAQAGLAVAWAVLICLVALVARLTWLAVVTTVLVGFVVLFSGVVSSLLGCGDDCVARLDRVLEIVLVRGIPDGDRDGGRGRCCRFGH